MRRFILTGQALAGITFRVKSDENTEWIDPTWHDDCSFWIDVSETDLRQQASKPTKERNV